MKWIGKILCWCDIHQWIPVREVWVRFRSPQYFENEYTQEGENIVSKIICVRCLKSIEIDIKK